MARADVRRAVWCALAAVASAAVGAVWRREPHWFVERLLVPYPYEIVMSKYIDALFDFPKLLFVLAGAFAVMAGAFAWAARRPPDSPARPFLRLSPGVETALFAALLGLNGWLSLRHWEHWERPLWDAYWRAGEILHQALRIHTAAVIPYLQDLMHSYPHSPSLLTPAAVALLMFIYPNSVLWMQLLNFAGIAGSVLLARRIAAKFAPEAPFWPIGLLMIANAASIRNALFIQIDGINGFVVMLFLTAWLRWRESPTPGRWAALVAAIVAAVFQKTLLFPAMAVPTVMHLYESWRERRFDLRRTVQIGLLTAALPFGLFLAYCFGFGLLRNFGLQVNLMGHGWNALDFAVVPLLFCTFFLLGPFIVPIARNRRLLEPRYFVFVVYFVFFWAAFVAVRGPFWTRYYSNVVGPCAVLSIPFFAEHAAGSRSRAPVYAFLFAVAVVEYALVFLRLVR